MDEQHPQFQSATVFEGFQCIACGRTFGQSNAYSTHVSSCRPQKRQMSGALELAKETYRRKKARLASVYPDSQEAEHSADVSLAICLRKCTPD